MNIAASSLLLSGLALALLALAVRNGIVSPFVVDAIFAAARWIFLAAMVFTTVCVCWSGVAERVLTIRYASGRSASWRHTYDGRRLDAVAGAAVSDGHSPGHSTAFVIHEGEER